MKKVLITIILAITPLTLLAQFSISSGGNAYLKNTIKDEHSILTVGEEPGTLFGDYGHDHYGIHVQHVNSALHPGNMGIYSSSTGSFEASSGCAVGVYGAAGGAPTGYNYGVIGSLSTLQNGAGIYGSTILWGESLVPGRYAGYFDGPTYVDSYLLTNALYQPADIRLSKDLRSLSVESEMTLSELCKLDVFSYRLKSKEGKGWYRTSNDKEISQPSQHLHESERLHYGLSAQNMLQVYPDLVHEGQDGYLAVNYTELVPVLVRAIQELKEELDAVKGVDEKTERNTRTATAVSASAVAGGNVLYQNTPNPFKEQTTIRFTLADDARDASVCIFDMTGKMLRKLPVSPGETSVTIGGWELGEGMFLYTLIVNGREIDTKRMIITK